MRSRFSFGVEHRLGRIKTRRGGKQNGFPDTYRTKHWRDELSDGQGEAEYRVFKANATRLKSCRPKWVVQLYKSSKDATLVSKLRIL